MADPLTLSVLSGAALAQGVTFLYGQAGEVLRRRRDRRESAGPGQPPQEVAVLEGDVDPLVADPEVVERVADELAELRRNLSEYADSIKPVLPTDHELLVNLDAIRGLLEAVYGQRFTFHGEAREPSGPVVTGSIDVEEVLGRAVAVRVGTVSGNSRVQAQARVTRVEAGGEVTGVDIDRIG